MRASRTALVVPLILGGAVALPLTAQTGEPEPFVVRHAALAIALDYPAQSLAGTMTLDLENWTNAPASRVSLLLNRLMEVSRVTDTSGAMLGFTQDVVRFRDDPMRQVTQAIVDIGRPIAPGARTSIRVAYAGNLVGYTEIGWLYVKDRIDTTLSIIRADALAFPELGGVSDEANRRRPRPDFTYDASVRVPAKYLVATGGNCTRVVNADGTATWSYTSQGASPFLNIVIARFDTLNTNGVRVFFSPEDSLGARRLMRATQSALVMLGKWFGPLHSQPSLTVTEIPDGWGSQADVVGGIIQTASAFRDAGRLGELYHELSHLWNVTDRESPSPRWNEGLAMFMQYLLQEKVDHWTQRADVTSRLLDRVKRSVATDSTLQHVPFIEYGSAKMTDRSYSVGQLMFATLYDLVGQKEFNRIVGGYYQRFSSGGRTRDFIEFARHSSTYDLGRFFDDWMLTTRWTALVANATTPAALVARYRTHVTGRSAMTPDTSYSMM
ncbi:MAG TPA: M1 family aminopeptidase [Gemmatimonadaceae bacterium]|jgi:aminopeptidase N